MSKLNANIPHFKAKVKKSYFTKNDDTTERKKSTPKPTGNRGKI